MKKLIISLVALIALAAGCNAAPAQNQQVGGVQPRGASKCHARGTGLYSLPDPVCTPGVTNPAITQANISQNICNKNWSTKSIRPPESYTSKLKIQQMQEYGFTDSPSGREEDHLISLELGGAPSDPKNLWPEGGASPNPKDKIENLLHSRVCNGQITLSEAQKEISQDWTKVK
jgi:hypothetical protein